jgi:hypothetical protein
MQMKSVTPSLPAIGHVNVTKSTRVQLLTYKDARRSSDETATCDFSLT